MHESCVAVLRTVLPSFDEEVGSNVCKALDWAYRWLE